MFDIRYGNPGNVKKHENNLVNEQEEIRPPAVW
jgi:hypothetical protein